ncbi:site-specific integrase [Lacihabitans sp. LS3-19]|uniref:site-specific integrase n=1 Tax=Lacihabitans sp. LS3-19 TaxID=2487335 RepID=UPI0020CDD647|nr:site-specific integrase [Lacihabitans sp. LS3-19]MCP9769445.1 site-specific integrase [Lacihabitans sp. LS3-19]
MQKITEKVKLRLRKTSDESSTLHLDYSINGKRNREPLNLKVYDKPRTILERQHNKEVFTKAGLIRNDREKQFFSDEIDEALDRKKRSNSDFYEYVSSYLTSYTKKDKRTMIGVFNAFAEFAPPPLSGKEVDESLCLKFRDYLSQNFSGETPASYFSRFKKLIKQALRDKYLKINPVEDIQNFKAEETIKKDVLTIDDLRALKAAQCGNEAIKTAFLFCCNTGLRFVDIKILKWENIKNNEIVIEQSKTNTKVEIPLNDNALNILSECKKGTEYIFDLPSHNAVVKSLQTWAKRAAIDKHLTFHCARHTFGTNLAFYGNDIASISELLGHTSLKHTMKYVRIGKELKQKGVKSLPNF